ncbi:hypothetical protein FBY51_0063 [Zymomonas mobilis]|nr:hypothetical protein ZZ6_0407 [Zymomonas mobilis subsp. mobilis ATCC 29191]TQK78262.1 hypothetical protein FBY53_0925 [Zymomonas mobilis]TQL15091.1 hypothetical protein FBY51_0063 [Zymomonas mobilis]
MPDRADFNIGRLEVNQALGSCLLCKMEESRLLKIGIMRDR